MMRKIVILFSFLILILLTSCGPNQSTIDLELEIFNFGNVVNGVIASKDVIVRNAGGTDLVINTVTTTCGCTSATLEPMTIPPGGEGILHIDFDSGAHGPYLTGEVLRRVILISNDPDQTEATVDFVANILAPENQE
jgi:hypothetical protein